MVQSAGSFHRRSERRQTNPVNLSGPSPPPLSAAVVKSGSLYFAGPKLVFVYTGLMSHIDTCMIHLSVMNDEYCWVLQATSHSVLTSNKTSATSGCIFS